MYMYMYCVQVENVTKLVFAEILADAAESVFECVNKSKNF